MTYTTIADELRDLLADPAVLDYDVIDDRNLRCRVEDDGGPAPTPVEVFADHTTDYSVAVEIEEATWTGYRIGRVDGAGR